MAKILLAEDDHTMIALLRTLLSMEGYEVCVADVDEDIPALILREKPDVVFMDVHLGQHSGLDFVDSIRRDPQFADLPVIMTSGLDVRGECLSRGATDFILKPFMPDDLLAIIRNRGA